MKLVKRISTFVLALILAVGMTSCSSTTWAVKSGGDTISTELYLAQLFYTFNGLYNQFYNDGQDPSTFFQQKVGEQSVKDFILDSAQNASKESIVVRQWMRELGIETSQEQLESNRKTAEDSYASNADYFNTIGLTREDVITYYEDYAAFQTLFNHIYGEGGEKGISLEDLKNEFYENNYRVEIFYVPLMTQTGGAIPEEEKQAIRDRLDGYAKELNEEGATFASIREKEVAITPSVASTYEDPAGYLSKADAANGDELSSTIAALAEGEAKAFAYSDYFYVLVQQMPIRSAETDKHVVDQQFSLRYSKFSEDFTAALENRINAVKFDLNKTVLNKYNPESFLVEASSSATTSTASSQ